MEYDRKRRGRGREQEDAQGRDRDRERTRTRQEQVEEDAPPVREDIVIGRNGVIELLKSGRPVDSILIAQGDSKGSITRIVAMAKEVGIPVKETNSIKMDYMCGKQNHQGVIAITAAASYATLDELFERAGDEAPFFIIADDIEDPHNLGAIIRTAEAAGAHGLILPKRGGVGLTATVSKTSAGAVEYLPVARVANLASTVEELKKRGVWVYGTDMDGTAWCDLDYAGPVALIVGSEGKGMSRLLREKCDFVASLPMKGQINSLNASVAAGIVMYEISRQRSFGKRN